MASYGIGAILRAERVRRGLSLEQVARKTKISARFLTAIEEEDFDSLPGLVFARGFIRQYATLLNLDSESLLASVPRVETNSLPLPAPQERIHSTSFAERWDPRWNASIASLLWIGLALAAAVGGYLYFNKPSPTVAATQTAPPKPAEPKRDVPSPAPAVAAAPTTITPASTPEDIGSTTPGKPVQVLLTASEASWVSITADGKNSFTGILQADEKKEVAADTAVRLIAGNAGGLRVSLNGKELEPLGPRGQVRIVRLTAAGPQIQSKAAGAPPLDPL